MTEWGMLGAPTSQQRIDLLFAVIHAKRMHTLPIGHKHPFDRMIITQAFTESLPVVTTDLAFAAHNVQVSSHSDFALIR